MDKLISILGPTATGKTAVAAALAHRIGGEVISADSRQVYRGMDLGTGKDLDDYMVEGKQVPYHLIDIADPGEEYNVFRFKQDFHSVFKDIISRGKQAIMCGGTGMYLESVLLGYEMSAAPVNDELRARLEEKSDQELIDYLKSLKEVHNVTDLNDRERLIRAIEIEQSGNRQPLTGNWFPESNIKHFVFGINLPRQLIRERITSRLKQRLEEGMVDEVRKLLDAGLRPEQLEFYGLEYKYLTQYATGQINYNDMFQRLNSAIHQFAKRQMTWFRRMQKKGIRIEWIDGELPLSKKIDLIIKKSGYEDH